MHRGLVVLASAFFAALLVGGAGATAPGVRGRIAFIATAPNFTSDIYSIHPDGSDPQRLTFGFDTKTQPSWSPDGAQIAYVIDGDVWVMDANGDNQHRVVDGREPRWSPDGTKLAVVRSDPVGGSRLWVVDPDGTGLRQVIDVTALEPDWSPDGTRLVYESSNGISTVGVDGSNPTTVVAAPGVVGSPSWSPDGQEIAFGRNSSISVVNVDGTDERQLTQGANDALPAWSPDGTQLAFQRLQTTGDAPQVYVMNADGSSQHALATGLAPTWGSSQVSPQVHPPQAPLIQISVPSATPGYVQGDVAHAAYRCDSAVSYVVSCAGDVAFGTQIDSSAGTHTFSVTATDADGRTAVASVTYDVVDVDPPRIAIRTPADRGIYALSSLVPVDYSCSDPGGLGVDFCLGSRAQGDPLDTSTLGTHTFSVMSGDLAKHVSSTSVTYTVVASPTVQIASPVDGAVYATGADVRASYSCTDLVGAGLRDCRGDVATGAAVDTTQPGTHTFTVTAADGLGDTTPKSVTYTVAAPPSVVIQAPAGDYTLGSSVAASYGCQSFQSTVSRCVGDAANGNFVDTSTIGRKAFTVIATDALGQTTTGTSSYRILYPFTGFDSPVAPNGAVTAKAGQGLPLKFSLGGAHGSSVVSAITWQTVSCADGMSLGQAVTGTGKLTYSATADRYQNVVATDSSWKGSCRRVTLQLDDTSLHSVTVTFAH